MNPIEKARGQLTQRMNVLWDETSFTWEMKKKILDDPLAFNLIDYLEIFDPDFDLEDEIVTLHIDKALETLKKLQANGNPEIGDLASNLVPHLGPDMRPHLGNWRKVISIGTSVFSDWSPHWSLSHLTQRFRDWRRGFSDGPAKEEKGKKIR